MCVWIHITREQAAEGVLCCVLCVVCCVLCVVLCAVLCVVRVVYCVVCCVLCMLCVCCMLCVVCVCVVVVCYSTLSTQVTDTLWESSYAFSVPCEWLRLLVATDGKLLALAQVYLHVVCGCVWLCVAGLCVVGLCVVVCGCVVLCVV